MLALNRFIEVLLLPPGSVLLLGLFGFLIVRHRRHFGRAIIGFALLLLWLFSTPLVSFALLDGLQNRYPPLIDIPPQADAIVVLGAGREFGVNEYGRDQDMSIHGSLRLRYGAYLARKTGLPLIFSGGQVWNQPGTEAELARAIAGAEYGIENSLVEAESRTTYENAVGSAALLDRHGWKNPLLVTEAWHMPRAMFSFNKVGIVALAAPTGRDTPDMTEKGVWALLPQAQSLERSRMALHEWLGSLWYSLQH